MKFPSWDLNSYWEKTKTLARNWRFLSLKKLLYLPRLLTYKEKRLYLLLLLIVVVAGGSFFISLYLKVTKPVPGVGGSYTEALLKEPRTINPIYASQDTDRDLVKLIFSSLFTYDSNGNITPDLAEKIDISPDNKIYTVTLKKNVSWHDGKPLNVDDVLFTIKTIQNPQYKSVLRANWQGVAVEKIDDYAVKFTLRVPYAPFIENLSVGIIPKHLWENVSPDQAIINELNLKPVGSGPYVFSDFKQTAGGSLVWYALSRNFKYYREGPYLQDITLMFFKTEDEAVSALHRKIVDGFGPLSINRTKEFDGQKVSIFSLAMPRIFGLFFNDSKNNVLKDTAVKKAIAYAVNKTMISQQAASGGAVVATSPLPFLNFQSSSTQDYTYNPEKAKQILENAGWKSIDSSGIRSKKTNPKSKDAPTTLRIKLTTSDWPDLLRAANIIQKNLKEVGIDLVIDKKSFDDLEQTVIRPRNFEILLFGQVYGYEPDPFAFWHSSQIKDPGLNISLYSNKDADKILEDARKISDPIVRYKKYQDFNAIFAKDMPAIFLYSQLYVYILPADIQGAELGKISLPSDRFNEINKWYVNTNRVVFKFWK